MLVAGQDIMGKSVVWLAVGIELRAVKTKPPNGEIWLQLQTKTDPNG